MWTSIFSFMCVNRLYLCQGCTSKICGILLFKVLKPTHECVNRRFLAYMSTVTLVVLCDSGVA